jgi:hypothetical protein
VTVSTTGFLFAQQQDGRDPGPGQATTTAGADTSAWFARRTVSPIFLVGKLTIARHGTLFGGGGLAGI